VVGDRLGTAVGADVGNIVGVAVVRGASGGVGASA
jgi:hypothetical protein